MGFLVAIKSQSPFRGSITEGRLAEVHQTTEITDGCHSEPPGKRGSKFSKKKSGGMGFSAEQLDTKGWLLVV